MELEMQSIWEAMKSSHYQRIMEELQSRLKQTRDLTEALTVALDKVVQAVHAEAGTFWFYDKFGDGRIRPRAVYGGGDLGDFSLAPGEGVAGQVIASGRAAIIPDCQKDPRWADKADAATGFQTRTMLCVPLYHRQDTFGCIQIINKTDGLPFDEKDLVFAENLAAHTALLFAEQRLLEGYEAAQDTAAAAVEPSFSALFGEKSFAEVEEGLLRVERVAALSETERKHVLRLSREIWMILDRARPAEPKAKRGFWGF